MFQKFWKFFNKVNYDNFLRNYFECYTFLPKSECSSKSQIMATILISMTLFFHGTGAIYEIANLKNLYFNAFDTFYFTASITVTALIALINYCILLLNRESMRDFAKQLWSQDYLPSNDSEKILDSNFKRKVR